MAKSPVAIPFSTDGVEIPVKDATAVPADARGFIGLGLDGATTRFIQVDPSGRQVFVGGGVAGTPAGGVLSVQGVSGGVAIPTLQALVIEKRLFDLASNTVQYIGYAPLGTAAASASWRINRLRYQANNLQDSMWSASNSVWNDRAVLAYT